MQTQKTRSWDLVEARKSRDHHDHEKFLESVRNMSVDGNQKRPSAAGKWKNVANYIEVSDRLKKSIIQKQPSLQDYEEKDAGRDRRSGSVPTDQEKNQMEVKQAYEKMFHKGTLDYIINF